VKECFSHEGVPFTARDFSEDAKTTAELEAVGVVTAKVTVVGYQVIVGLDRRRLEQTLKNHRAEFTSPNRSEW
jgi:hypothetical protein